MRRRCWGRLANRRNCCKRFMRDKRARHLHLSRTKYVLRNVITRRTLPSRLPNSLACALLCLSWFLLLLLPLFGFPLIIINPRRTKRNKFLCINFLLICYRLKRSRRSIERKTLVHSYFFWPAFVHGGRRSRDTGMVEVLIGEAARWLPGHSSLSTSPARCSSVCTTYKTLTVKSGRK